MLGMSGAIFDEFRDAPDVIERFRYREHPLLLRVEAGFSEGQDVETWQTLVLQLLHTLHDEDLYLLAAIPPLTKREWQAVSASALLVADFVRFVSTNSETASKHKTLISLILLLLAKEANKRGEAATTERDWLTMDWTDRIGPKMKADEDLKSLRELAAESGSFVSVFTTHLIHELIRGELTERDAAGIRLGFSITYKLMLAVQGVTALNVELAQAAGDEATANASLEVAVFSHMLAEVTSIMFGVTRLWFDDPEAAHDWADEIGQSVQQALSQRLLAQAFAALHSDGEPETEGGYDA